MGAATAEDRLRGVGDGTLAALRRSSAGALRMLDRWTQRPRWRLAATGVILLAALFVAFPSIDAVGGERWDSMQLVGQEPFIDHGFAPDSHASKNVFRITVPILGEALGLSPAGYMVLHALFGVLLIFTLLVALERVTSDRVTAFLLALASCMTYAGVVSFIETRAMFDGVALALLLVAFAWPRVPVIVTMVFLAGWTDERTLFASGFLIAMFWFQRVAQEPIAGAELAPEEGSDRRTAQIIAVLAGVLAYGLSRIAVVIAFDLPQHTGGVGPAILFDQINNAAVGLWTGLEGLWVALSLAVVLMWRASFRLLALFTVAVTGFISVFAVSVVDITRSMGFLLPSVVLSAAVLAAMLGQPTLRRVAGICLALSVAWPVYYVGGKNTIWWMYPLPVQAFRLLTGAG